jgi:hypothetical protein
MASGNSSISGSYFYAPHNTQKQTQKQEQEQEQQQEINEIKAIPEPEKERKRAKSQSKLMLGLSGQGKSDGLTKAQEAKLVRHGKKHSAEHIALMRIELEAGKTWNQAHESAINQYGD